MKLIPFDSPRYSASIDTRLEGQDAFPNFFVFLEQILGFWGSRSGFGSKMKLSGKTATAIRSGMK